MKNIFTVIFCLLFALSGITKNSKNHKEKNDSTLGGFVGKPILPRMQSVYMEFFGSSANTYSWNYERCIYLHKCESRKWNRLSLRGGVNYDMGRYAVPMMIHFSRGRDYCFEAGGGWVPWFSTEKRIDGVAVFSGFRYQPGRTGLMARFALTPTYMIGQKEHWHMIFGFSFGWAF